MSDKKCKKFRLYSTQRFLPVPGIIDETINKKGSVHKNMTNMNELVGYLSRHFDEYMDADTHAEKFSIIRCIFDFAISPRVRDKKAVVNQIHGPCLEMQNTITITNLHTDKISGRW